MKENKTNITTAIVCFIPLLLYVVIEPIFYAVWSVIILGAIYCLTGGPDYLHDIFEHAILIIVPCVLCVSCVWGIGRTLVDTFYIATKSESITFGQVPDTETLLTGIFDHLWKNAPDFIKESSTSKPPARGALFTKLLV